MKFKFKMLGRGMKWSKLQDSMKAKFETQNQEAKRDGIGTTRHALIEILKRSLEIAGDPFER